MGMERRENRRRKKEEKGREAVLPQFECSLQGGGANTEGFQRRGKFRGVFKLYTGFFPTIPPKASVAVREYHQKKKIDLTVEPFKKENWTNASSQPTGSY